MPTLFEFLGSINSGDKIDLEVDNPYSSFVPFQINNGLAQHMDTVLLANEMNKYPDLTPEMQYKFYLNSVTKKKRFGKWAKVEPLLNQIDIDEVSKYFQVNKVRAAEYLRLLSLSEFENIVKLNNPGGCDSAPRVATKPKKPKVKK